MNLLKSLAKLVKDPPPTFVFELSEAGIAGAQAVKPPKFFFRELERDVLSVSPTSDNVLRADTLLAEVRNLAPPNGGRKRRSAALILPDYSVRVSILDFDAFPPDSKEQLSLVRFRLRRTVPFDVESAALSYYPQPASGKGGGVDVVAAIAPVEIVARYEAPFRNAGFQTGHVTTSLLAALPLVPSTGLRVFAKRMGRVLSIAVQDDGVLKLVRSIELDAKSMEEVVSHLFPTLAYVEDELAARPESLVLCGFHAFGPAAREELQSELGVPVTFANSRFASPDETNAGLLGYVESLEDY